MIRNPYAVRGNKYGVSPKEQRTADGIVFASKAEMQRYLELRLAKQGGAIRDFKRQPKYQLTRLVAYKPDFEVIENDGAVYAEEIKGIGTEAFGLRQKLWREFGPHPLVILRRSGQSWERETVMPMEKQTCFLPRWRKRCSPPPSITRKEEAARINQGVIDRQEAMEKAK